MKGQPCATIIEFGVFSDQALKAAERCAAGVTAPSECSLCDPRSHPRILNKKRTFRNDRIDHRAPRSADLDQRRSSTSDPGRDPGIPHRPGRGTTTNWLSNTALALLPKTPCPQTAHWHQQTVPGRILVPGFELVGWGQKGLS